MVHYSLKRLLVSIALIAVGVALGMRILNLHLLTEPGRVPLWFISEAMSGAGVFTPFRRPILGVVFGVALPAMLLVVLGFLVLSALESTH